VAICPKKDSRSRGPDLDAHGSPIHRHSSPVAGAMAEAELGARLLP
jgi:hypothetical protein